MKHDVMVRISKYCRWIVLVCIVAMIWLITPAVNAAQVKAQGKWGDNITWTLNDEGTLTLTGAGEMAEGDAFYDEFNETSLELYPWINYMKDIKKVVIGEGITNVATKAFGYYHLGYGDESDGYYDNLTVVEFPSTITEIKDSAFNGCVHMTDIRLPENLKSIGNGAFSGCRGLKKMEIPASVTVIPERAFEGCTNMDSIVLPQTITKIGQRAFRFCKGLTRIEIPENTTQIDSNAFAGCTGVKEVTIPAGIKKVGKKAFYQCAGIQKVTFEGDNNINLGDYCFSQCTSLTKIELPAKQTTLKYTFAKCTSLETVKIPKQATTLTGTFMDCTALQNIVIPENVKTLDGKLFYNCKNLKKIVIQSEKLDLKKCANKDMLFRGMAEKAVFTLPDKKFATYKDVLQYFVSGKAKFVNSKGRAQNRGTKKSVIESGTWGKNIAWELGKDGTLTFSGKGAMKAGRVYYMGEPYEKTDRYPWSQYAGYIKKIVVKNGITNVPQYAFSCDSGIGTINPCVNLKTVQLGTSVKEIGSGAFAKCTGLKQINFPKALLTIGERAFENCVKLGGISFPEKLETIRQSAFRGCTKVKNVTLPQSIKAVNGYAFENCSNLTTVTFRKNKNKSMTLGDGAFRNCKKLKKVTLSDNAENMQNTFQNCVALETVELPAQLKTMGEVFAGCKALKKITIPVKVEYMYSANFKNCTKLKKVVFDTKKLVELGGENFSGCAGLTEVKIPASTRSIGWQAFMGCTKLTAVTIPGKVRTIGVDAFRECTALETVEFEKNTNSTLTMERCCFKNCTRLKQIELPDNVKKMRYTFQNCTSLEAVTLPEQLVLIEKAFTNCTSLREITIPEKVETISDGGFYQCANLKKIVFQTEKWDCKQEAGKLFAGIAEDAVFTLPAAKYDSYKAVIELSAPVTSIYNMAEKQ